jgi:hypothetical protein
MTRWIEHPVVIMIFLCIASALLLARLCGFIN